jgi:hypothetical protein
MDATIMPRLVSGTRDIGPSVAQWSVDRISSWFESLPAVHIVRQLDRKKSYIFNM